MTTLLEAAERVVAAATSEQANIAENEAVDRYYLAVAAGYLLQAAMSDLHPGYVQEKIGKAILALSYVQELPIVIDLEVAGGVVTEHTATVRGRRIEVEFNIVDLDGLEEDDS